MDLEAMKKMMLWKKLEYGEMLSHAQVVELLRGLLIEMAHAINNLQKRSVTEEKNQKGFHEKFKRLEEWLNTFSDATKERFEYLGVTNELMRKVNEEKEGKTR